MKNIKKIIIGVFLTIFIVSLFACTVKPQNDYVVKETAASSFGGNVNGFARTSLKMAAPMAVADMAVEEVAEVDGEAGVSDRKIIKNVDINAETKEFDSALDWLKGYVTSYSGIIDSSYIDSGNMTSVNYQRNASFTVRVPAEKLDSFLSNIGSKLNITYQHENVRDVTDVYDDTESRQKTLLIEEEKLNELLSKAKNIDDIITIENKLSEVRNELANISKRLKRLDKQIDYSTVTLSIVEVKDLSNIVNANDYSKENILRLMNKNFEETKQAVIAFGINVITHIPSICLVLIIIVVILIIIAIIRAIVSPKNKKVAAKTATKKTKTDTKKENKNDDNEEDK